MQISLFTNRRCFNNQKLFEPFWSSSEDFEEILISSLMWADHMPDYVLYVLKETFQRLHSTDYKRSDVSPPCRQHHRGMQRCPSDNASCYISVLDSPTGKTIYIKILYRLSCKCKFCYGLILLFALCTR